MAALTADRITRKRAGGYSRTVIGKVAAATKIYLGSMVCKNAAGFIVAGVNTAGFTVVGVALEQVDNLAGANGAKEIAIDTNGVFKFANDGADPVVQADMHGVVWLSDDQTVRNADAAAVVRAGVCEQIDSDGVWVHIDVSTNIALAT